MSIQIRPAVPVHDYARIAEILTAYSDTAITPQQVATLNRVYQAGDIRLMCCAVDAQDTVLGFGTLSHRATSSTGVFSGGVAVDPAHTRQGIGTALYEALYAAFLAHGGTRWRSGINETDPAGMVFAQKRGFVQTHRIFQSYLEVATFDETPFVAVLARVAAQGIGLSTLADEGLSRANLRKLYEIDRISNLSLPDWEGDFTPFEHYVTTLQDDPSFDPAARYLAIDRTTGDYVGIAGLFFDRETRIMIHEVTGVLPAYQRRGIALALKLLTIRHAKTHGARLLYAHNHSKNAAVIAMNRKLGYEPMAGTVFYERAESACDKEPQ